MGRTQRRRNRTLAAAAAAGMLATPAVAGAQIPAFPGADGAAANVSGGRGGIVYHVTKLNSAIDDPLRNDPGTIRYGLNNANFPPGVARTIVFDVGGVFHLGRLPQPASNWDPNGNGWDAQSRLTIGGTNVTLAGQTAPGRGVIFMGGGLKPQGNNNIIRNITMASGYGLTGWWKPGDPFPSPPGTTSDPAGWFPDNTVYDGMDISGTNLMIDHVSTLYATDETISMNEVANNITVQYSNISQGQNYPQWDAEGGGLTGHALGSLLEAGNITARAAISFHHNLYAHHKGRVPQMQAGGLGAYYDFRNNAFYNWFGTAGSKSGTTFLNLVNNFYLAGPGGDNPAGGNNPAINTQSGGTGVLGASSSIYRNGNLLDSNKDGDANDGAPLSAGGAANALWLNGVPTYSGVTDSAAQAFERVLNYMGANWWTRDAVIDTPDERIINEARTGTGKVKAWADDPWNADPNEGVEWRALLNTPAVSRASDWDQESDLGFGRGDGMPTWWELAHGLHPLIRDDTGDFDSDGYTNLEEYLNDVAAWPAPSPLVFTGATNGRYEQITNWDIKWQPSKYDEARIHSGNVTVDSVGQHARVLNIAPGAGESATLTLSAGWIDVAERLKVANNGQVIMDGGQLLVPAVQLSGNALLKLTPGGTKVLSLESLSISGSAKLDLSDNRLIVKGATVPAVEEAIAVGHDGGEWGGPGIMTSMPDAASGLTSLAAASAQQVLGVGAGQSALWGGETVVGVDVLVRYTYTGDATMDGFISGDDYSAIDFASGIAGASGWFNGDFNYDGFISADDYSAIDFNLVAQGAPFPSYASAALSVAAVPEPAACLFATTAATYLAAARRRRRAK